jgi:hypothetical protein
MLFQIIIWTAIVATPCGFVIRFGDRVMRLAAIWMLANIVAHSAASLAWDGSPTFHLVDDGIYATGLLPLAFFSVSPWIGALALLACGSFILQSVYLLADRPTDLMFMVVNNVITLTALLVLTVGGAGPLVRRVRERARARAAA